MWTSQIFRCASNISIQLQLKTIFKALLNIMSDQKLHREKKWHSCPNLSKTKKNLYDTIKPVYLELLGNEKKKIKIQRFFAVQAFLNTYQDF